MMLTIMASGSDMSVDSNENNHDFDDNSSDSEFSGFELDDILDGARILGEIDMIQCERDRNFPDDWSREDVPHPLIAPFTGMSGIKLERSTKIQIP